MYSLPSFDPKDMKDSYKVRAYSLKAEHAPYAWLVYLPQGEDMMQMQRQIPRQWASDTLAALALAFMLGVAVISFRRRLAIAAVASLFAWLIRFSRLSSSGTTFMPRPPPPDAALTSTG